ncbi:MAG: hypothetical protein IT370_28245 [Deltaproteobacteria bacterium]|nr:hypothetical protein [Deltaproteobacteria bacterium]
MAAYPFRFYGAAALDWFEGIQDYELHFEVEPSPEDRLRIARAFEGALRGNAGVSSDDIYPRKGWWWSGAHALCPLRRALSPGDDLGEFNEGVEDALRRVHEVAPLVEVVNLSAREVDDDWTNWSREQLAVPGDAPRWPQKYDPKLVVCAAGQRRTKPAREPEVDAAFEEERTLVRTETIREAAGDAAARALAAGKVALVPIDRADMPARAATASAPADVVTLCPKESRFSCAPDGRTWVSFEWDGTGYAVALVADGVRRPVELAPWKMFLSQHAFTGQRMILGGHSEVFAVDLASAEVSVVLQGMYSMSMGALTASAAGVLAAAATGSLQILDPAQPERSPRWYRAMRCHYPKQLTFVAGGKALLVVEGGRRFGTAVLGFCDGAIKLLTKLEAAALDVYEADGRIFSGEGLELVNLETAWQAAFADGGLGPEADQAASINLADDWWDG